MRRVLTIAATLCALGIALAQHDRPARLRGEESRPLGVTYYDVDALYDTLPSRFYDDRAYTPQGRMRWDTQRYRRKIENTARVIDSMHMDIVVLYGVENEQVVRDIVEACENDYAYLHRTSDAYNGLDFAILYFGDRFFPERVVPWRGAIGVQGSTCGGDLTLVADHRSTSLGVLMQRMGLRARHSNIIVLGRHNKLNFDEYGLTDHTARAEAAGRGNERRDGYWRMRDRIASNIDGAARCDVYVKSWMLTSDGRPHPTFDRAKYHGGYGNYLPVFIYFDERVGY